MRTKWNGSDVRRERAQWRKRLPLPCCRCGWLIVEDPSQKSGGWQVDHYPISRELGGTQTWPAHSRCNMSAGGKRGAEITNAKRSGRVVKRPTMYKTGKNIRGI